jgi:hypothetical protein
MQQASEEYRGFSITVVPVKDHEDLWDYEYRLKPLDAAPANAQPEIRRAGTAGGRATPEIAIVAGMCTAKTEVDNLLALKAATP